MFFLDYMRLGDQYINSLIGRLSTTGKPQEDFLFSNIFEWNASKCRKTMLIAQHYYKNENEINLQIRQSINANGVKEPTTTLANNKLAHAFFRKLVRQKVNYLLSKKFSIQTDDKILEENLTNIVSDKFYKQIKASG